MCRTVRKTLSMVWLIAVVQPQCGNALRHMTDTGVPYYSVSRQQHPPPCHTMIVVRTCVRVCVCACVRACVRICVCACVRASLLGHAAAPKKACPASSCKSRRLPPAVLSHRVLGSCSADVHDMLHDIMAHVDARSHLLERCRM